MSPVKKMRRTFLGMSTLGVLGLAVDGRLHRADAADPIIDIHQHLGYTGRTDAALLTHQRVIGATTTILLPAGRSVDTTSTHKGVANGLQAQALGNEACHKFARAYRQ